MTDKFSELCTRARTLATVAISKPESRQAQRDALSAAWAAADADPKRRYFFASEIAHSQRW